MNLISLLLLSVGCAMDAVGVVISKMLGGSNKLFLYAFLFGIFQILMPILGYYTFSYVGGFFHQYSNLISFSIFFYLGISMLLKREETYIESDTLFEAILLSIATSLDAFMVGVSYAIRNEPCLINSIVIGIVTFILCFIFGYLAKLLGSTFSWSSKVGGILLLILSFQMLFS